MYKIPNREKYVPTNKKFVILLIIGGAAMRKIGAVYFSG